MATTVMIIGESGSGKSAALRNLSPEKSVLLNVLGKPLPFKNGNLFDKIVSDNPTALNGYLLKINDQKKNKQIIILDDFQYIMANMYMKSLLEPKTKDSEFNKYKEIGFKAWTLIRTAQSLRSDVIVFFLAHSEIDVNGKTKCKTIGKLLDEKIVLEGMFTIVLNTIVHQDKPVNERYCFQTQNNGNNTTKSPMGMFEQEEITNDLQIVVNQIQSYYGG